MEQQKVDLDALEAALARATPGEWTVEMDGPDDDDSPCDVVIPEINRILHSTEWADPEDFEQDVANAEAIVAAHNALPALIAELRQLRARITPEVIGEKHRDGNWWLVWGGDMDKWVIAHHDELMWQWYRDCGLSVNPTHALPLPPAPEPPAPRGE
jgi:hypothetical protein